GGERALLGHVLDAVVGRLAHLDVDAVDLGRERFTVELVADADLLARAQHVDRLRVRRHGGAARVVGGDADADVGGELVARVLDDEAVGDRPLVLVVAAHEVREAGFDDLDRRRAARRVASATATATATAAGRLGGLGRSAGFGGRLLLGGGRGRDGIVVVAG